MTTPLVYQIHQVIQGRHRSFPAIVEFVPPSYPYRTQYTCLIQRRLVAILLQRNLMDRSLSLRLLSQRHLSRSPSSSQPKGRNKPTRCDFLPRHCRLHERSLPTFSHFLNGCRNIQLLSKTTAPSSLHLLFYTIS